MSTIQRGEHFDKMLSMGVEAHLVRRPGSDKWKIKSLDTSWGTPEFLNTKTWFAGPLGVGEMEFDSTDAACSFLEKRVKLSPATHS